MACIAWDSSLDLRPMPLILLVLLVADLAAIAITTWMGLNLSDATSIRHHLTAGVATAILLVFTHSLVLFYLIGTGIDIREAIEGHDALTERFLPLTRALKRRVFPWACSGAALMIIAALLGADVHSRLISLAIDQMGRAALEPGAQMPLRQVGGWWLHISLTAVAVAVNIKALLAEFQAALANRRAILEINRVLAPEAALPDLSGSG